MSVAKLNKEEERSHKIKFHDKTNKMKCILIVIIESKKQR